MEDLYISSGSLIPMVLVLVQAEQCLVTLIKECSVFFLQIVIHDTTFQERKSSSCFLSGRLVNCSANMVHLSLWGLV